MGYKTWYKNIASIASQLRTINVVYSLTDSGPDRCYHTGHEPLKLTSSDTRLTSVPVSDIMFIGSALCQLRNGLFLDLHCTCKHVVSIDLLVT